MYVIQWVRSLLFNIQMYVMMLILGIVFLIPMILHPWGAHTACMLYARWVIWTASWMVGVKVEIRGTPPTDPVLIAAKHQSFLDIMVIFANIPWGKFVMKQELMYAPILGVFSRRLGCIPVSRGKGASAVKKMLSDVEQGHTMPGQVVIYPQGTR
ncbi:MAG: lysophospholipid acyltransferase family protein, partial [Planktomarina sp.]